MYLSMCHWYKETTSSRFDNILLYMYIKSFLKK